MSPEHAQSQCPENNELLHRAAQGGEVVVLEGLVILILHTGKLRLREAKRRVQSHTAHWWPPDLYKDA